MLYLAGGCFVFPLRILFQYLPVLFIKKQPPPHMHSRTFKEDREGNRLCQCIFGRNRTCTVKNMEMPFLNVHVLYCTVRTYWAKRFFPARWFKADGRLAPRFAHERRKPTHAHKSLQKRDSSSVSSSSLASNLSIREPSFPPSSSLQKQLQTLPSPSDQRGESCSLHHMTP